MRDIYRYVDIMSLFESFAVTWAGFCRHVGRLSSRGPPGPRDVVVKTLVFQCFCMCVTWSARPA